MATSERHLGRRQRIQGIAGTRCRSDSWFGKHARFTSDPARLAEAVALYQGEFLADLYLDDCREFESRLRRERELLCRQMVTALDQLVGFHALRHEDDLAQQYARCWLELDPLDEAACAALMLLLACNGQRNAALMQY